MKDCLRKIRNWDPRHVLITKSEGLVTLRPGLAKVPIQLGIINSADYTNRYSGFLKYPDGPDFGSIIKGIEDNNGIRWASGVF